MSSEVLFIPDIHIGNCISECIQKSPFTKAEIARSINMNPANFNKLLKKKSIETDRLIEISHALAYNFFAASVLATTGEAEIFAVGLSGFLTVVKLNV